MRSKAPFSSSYLDADEVHTAVFGYSPDQKCLACAWSSIEKDSRAVPDRKIGKEDWILKNIKRTLTFYIYIRKI